ncbi:MAG: imidazole glycerol phosphate synthase subunit HisH [Promethearchaeota archaeon]
MNKIRIIPRLDVKGPNVVKGINFEGLRVVGNPSILAKKYYDQGADEILYIDIVASLYERNNLVDIVDITTSVGAFIPITVGGGVRTLEDIRELLYVGADKIAINTAATKNPKFITEAAKMFGSQSIVGSIEAKKIGLNKWEAYIDCGREKTGLDAIEWAGDLVELGAGELLITSVDHEGEQRGYDLELYKAINKKIDIPLVLCGGAGNKDHIKRCLDEISCDGISMASILHYNKITIEEIKNYLKKDYSIRTPYKADKFFNSHFNKKRKKVSIIDYGVGNIKSVYNAFKKVGNKVEIIEKPNQVENADMLVIPGVGAFEDGMNGLKERKLIDPICEHINNDKPLLGICLGMQLLMSQSEEFGLHEGLDVIKGKVIKFKDPFIVKEKGYVVPQIGWNKIFSSKYQKWEGSILNDVPNFSEVYFVHSYYPVLEENKHILAMTEYGGQKFCSSYRKGNVYGTQFHPEKSADVGLIIINNFGQL